MTTPINEMIKATIKFKTGITESYEKKDDGWYYKDQIIVKAADIYSFETFIEDCIREGLEVVTEYKHPIKTKLSTIYEKQLSDEDKIKQYNSHFNF